MFDDDNSYLDRCARELQKYGLTVLYPYDRCIMVVLRESQMHSIAIVRKREKLPFYQAFLFQLHPTNLDYLREWQQDRLVRFMYENPKLVQMFYAGDVSGHANFENEFLRELKERFK